MSHKATTTPKRSKDARFLRSRSALRDGLIRVLQRAELAHVTVQMIVAEAGIGYATFFRHYPSLEALLIAVADKMISEVARQAVPALAARDTDALLDVVVGYVSTHRRSIGALLVGGGERVRREITARAVAQAEALPFELDPLVPRDLGIAHMVNASIDVVTWWITRDELDSNDHLTALLRRLALAPVIATQAGQG